MSDGSSDEQPRPSAARHASVIEATVGWDSGAALTVIVVVLGAFVGATVTKLTAETTNFFQEMRIASHEVHRQPAHVRTVSIPADAFGERGSI